MAKGLSLHVGLNRVDPSQYGGWDGQLAGCHNDAFAMQKIAVERGFDVAVLLDGEATAARVLGEIDRMATALKPGDIFFVTYSGHGGQVPDTNGDEPDGLDETWVLYDRQLIDDELYAAWGRFRSGVRIAILSDSCHSGSVSRAMLRSEHARALFAESGDAGALRSRAMPAEAQAKDIERRGVLYERLQSNHPAGDQVSVGASALLVSGCQDNQTSADGAVNGLFTEKLLRVWALNNGHFPRGYRQLWKGIQAMMPAVQTPQFSVVGLQSPAFEAEDPFSIVSAANVASGSSSLTRAV